MLWLEDALGIVSGNGWKEAPLLCSHFAQVRAEADDGLNSHLAGHAILDSSGSF